VPSPTPATLIDADLLAEGARAEVAIAGLRLSDAPAGQPFADVEEGQVIALLGATERDGVRWWLVQAPYRGSDLFGWVPDALDGISTLVSMAPGECPDPSLGFVEGAAPAERLRCWRGQRLTFDGWVTGWQITSAYVGRPPWLAANATLAITDAIGPAVNGPALPLHIPPGRDPPPLTPRDGPAPDTQVLITGHFDDSHSDECRHEPDIPGVMALDAAVSTYWCRQRFVVEDWELIPAS
jgi:hypothetical protein